MNEHISALAENYQHYVDITLQYGFTYMVKIALALLIFLIGKRVARALTNFVVKAMQKSELDRELTELIESLLYWGIVTLATIAALAQVGVQTASFIAILGAAGLAIGLAMQGSLSNLAAGVLILVLRPFSAGDWVEMAGVAGSVKNIGIFTTELRTGDNKCVIIPNARVLESNIVNHSSTGERRVDMVFGISYEDDIDKAKKVIRDVVEQDDRVLQNHDIRIAVSELAESSVNFVVRPWVNTPDYQDVLFSLNENIKKEFDKQNISIPYPQRVVHGAD